jgi:endonuclease/exonuclease/phosphatase family metal-dependent hydrolase
MTLRVASYNIRFGGYGRASAIVGVLEAMTPDVVILQEATAPAIVHEIGQGLGMGFVEAQPGRSVAALSRTPFAGSAWHDLRPGRRTLEVVLGETDVRIFGVHLSAGLSRRGEARRIVEVGRLLEHVATAGSDRVLLVGDFNAIAPGDGPLLRLLPLWIRLLLRFDGGIRTEAMQRLIDAGYIDMFRYVHPAEPGLTMPSIVPSVRLDYVLAGAGVAGHIVDVERAAPSTARASDHLAIVAGFDLEGS